jgi:hypothetical protein
MCVACVPCLVTSRAERKGKSVVRMPAATVAPADASDAKLRPSASARPSGAKGPRNGGGTGGGFVETVGGGSAADPLRPDSGKSSLIACFLGVSSSLQATGVFVVCFVTTAVYGGYRTESICPLTNFTRMVVNLISPLVFATQKQWYACAHSPARYLHALCCTAQRLRLICYFPCAVLCCCGVVCTGSVTYAIVRIRFGGISMIHIRSRS